MGKLPQKKKNWGSFVHRGLRYEFLRKKIWTVPLILQFNIWWRYTYEKMDCKWTFEKWVEASETPDIWEVWCERGVRVINNPHKAEQAVIFGIKFEQIFTWSPAGSSLSGWIVSGKQCLKYLYWHLAARMSVSDCQQVVSNLAAAATSSSRQ